MSRGGAILLSLYTSTEWCGNVFTISSLFDI